MRNPNFDTLQYLYIPETYQAYHFFLRKIESQLI